jgi:hypothetical protein
VETVVAGAPAGPFADVDHSLASDLVVELDGVGRPALVASGPHDEERAVGVGRDHGLVAALDREPRDLPGEPLVGRRRRRVSVERGDTHAAVVQLPRPVAGPGPELDDAVRRCPGYGRERLVGRHGEAVPGDELVSVCRFRLVERVKQRVAHQWGHEGLRQRRRSYGAVVGP